MKRHNITSVNVNELKVDTGLNYRDDYDIASLQDDVIRQGRILEPLHVELETKRVLRGNRRTLTAQKLYNDPTTAPELRAALEKLEVIFYSELTDSEREELVLDHGSQKSLTRTEIVKAVWRLAMKMYSEREIIGLLYQRLAEFTGNKDKAQQVSRMTDKGARDKFLAKWLHGTVGNYLLPAARMGENVKEQLLLTERNREGTLTDEEEKSLLWSTNRDRIGDLNTAKNEDGAAWEPTKGGPKFNAQIEAFIKEDADKKAGLDKKSGKRKYSADDMKNAADTMQSPLRLAFLQCAGELDDAGKSKVIAADAEFYRIQRIMSALIPQVERVNEPNVRALLSAITRPEGTETQALEALAKFAEAQDAQTKERDTLKAERDALAKERDTLAKERDALKAADTNGKRRATAGK